MRYAIVDCFRLRILGNSFFIIFAIIIISIAMCN